jgi:hypothetical protein
VQRTVRSLLALAIVFPAAALADAPVTLTAPADGTVLVPGRMVEVAWARSGTAEPALDGPIEEWEAFLSVDGGRSYPFRVTPHLDIDLARFRFVVPAVASNAARILLRFGDERREVGFEMPQRLSIAPPGPLAELRRASASPVLAARRGEAARPGAAGVTTWVEGTRRGDDLRVHRTASPLALRGVPTVSGGPMALALLAPKRDDAGLDGATEASRHERLAPAAERAAPRAAAALAPILLLISRSNR